MKRRAVLKTAGVVALGFQVVPRYVVGQGQKAPSEKLNIAGIGIQG